jgi:hypothetical protein
MEIVYKSIKLLSLRFRIIGTGVMVTRKSTVFTIS